MSRPTPETAKVVVASEVRIGDEIYIKESWFDSPPGMGNRWRTIVDIQEAPEDSLSDFIFFPEILHQESRHLIQWMREDTLVIMRK